MEREKFSKREQPTEETWLKYRVFRYDIFMISHIFYEL